MRARIPVLGLATVVGLAGCLDLKEDVVTGVTGSFYGSEQGADASLTAAYGDLRLFYAEQEEITVTELGTDSWEKGSEVGAEAFWNDYTPQLSPTAGGDNALQQHWTEHYQGVNAANQAITALENLTTMDSATRATKLAEARFLRALYYHNLTRSFGAVQLNLEPTTEPTTAATRTPVEEIYATEMIPDLEFAIANLPLTQSQRGRATQTAAQTLLAEVYLTRAAEGDFAKAIELTTAVINSGVHTLNPSFKGIFCGPDRLGSACDFVVANEGNPEFIWAVQFTADPATDPFGNSLHLYYTMAYDIQGAPDLRRTVEYGRPFRRLRPTLHLLNIWNRATDSRYDATFQHLWVSVSGARDTAIFLPGTDVVPPQYQGKPYKAFGQNDYTPALFPTLLKWLDQTRPNPQTFEGQRDRHLWRLADLYLMRAEANIRSGNVAAAIPDFNILRRRAAWPGMEAANEIGPAELAQLNASPLDFLLDERERELAGEEFRWWVLTRMGKLVDRVQRFNTAAAPNIQPFHVLRPIPQTQIDRTEGGAAAFPQNPGY
jgi:starch-binding outer membrane protein, SusD/RagB family